MQSILISLFDNNTRLFAPSLVPIEKYPPSFVIHGNLFRSFSFPFILPPMQCIIIRYDVPAILKFVIDRCDATPVLKRGADADISHVP